MEMEKAQNILWRKWDNFQLYHVLREIPFLPDGNPGEAHSVWEIKRNQRRG